MVLFHLFAQFHQGFIHFLWLPFHGAKKERVGEEREMKEEWPGRQAGRASCEKREPIVAPLLPALTCFSPHAAATAAAATTAHLGRKERSEKNFYLKEEEKEIFFEGKN